MLKKWTCRVLILICGFIIGLQLMPSGGHAQNFPDREGKPVIDLTKQLEQPELNHLSEYIHSLPHEYVVVFLESLEEEGFEYTRRLFDHYQLGDNAILFVVTTEEPVQLFYAYGQGIAAKGLTDQAVKEREENMFKPYVREQNFLTGMNQLIHSLELELENLALRQEREAELSIHDSLVSTESTEKESFLSGWLVLFLLLILLILLFVVLSLIYRRRITRIVDDLEAWKIDIENRPFSAQLARIKGLKMAGETEAQFEKWRAEWEEILNTTLPNIEEILIDIEEEADRYRFFRVKRLIARTEEKLQEIEDSLDRIVAEIDELTSNEKQNRELAAKLHEEYQELRIALHKNSLSLGISYAIWFEKFKKTTEWFEEFHQAQEGGDYLRAKDILVSIQDVFNQIREAIQLTPELVRQIEQEVPNQIREVELAVQEMKEKGYKIDHLGVEEKIAELGANKQEIVSYMEKGQIEEMKNWLERFNQEIEQIYVAFEGEVEAKAFVLRKMEEIPALLENLKETQEQLLHESEQTRQSYTWDEEWEETLAKLNKWFEELLQLGSLLVQKKEEAIDNYPVLKPDIERFEELREEYQSKLEEFKKELDSLREDELKALELLKKMSQTMIKIKVNIRKSNLPGIPDHLSAGMAMAEEALKELEGLLNEVPLNRHKIQHQLREAKSQVESVSQVAKAVIEQAYRAEQLIPYANRFRRSSQEINFLLTEAEEAFRNLQFREAVELVEEALDLADKNWRKKLDDQDFAV